MTADDLKLRYSKNGIMSRNCLFNWILGARGTGKTYTFKEYALDSPGECVWVRRYQEDIDELKATNEFLSDLFQTSHKYDNLKIEWKGNKLYIDGLVKIHFIALSTAQRKKSQSFYNVDKMVFDEVLESLGRSYLKKEINKFLELYETVNRLRGKGDDTRKEVRVFFLANKVSFVNPYFSYWGITPFTERYKTFKNGTICVENYTNKDFEEAKKDTQFGKLISGTTYSDYSIDNVCWEDNNSFITKRTVKSVLRANIRIGETTIGIWTDDNRMYCSKAYNPAGRTYAPRYEMLENEHPLTMNKLPVTWLVLGFERGYVYFDDNVVKDFVFRLMQGQFD